MGRNWMWVAAALLLGGCDDGDEQGTVVVIDAGGFEDGGVANPPPDAGEGLSDMGADAAPEGCVDGLPVLGCGSHSLEAVEVEILGDRSHGLSVPRDLDFNPEKPGELWVVNRRDDSTSTWLDVDDPDAEVIHRIDPFAEHFMEEVSSIDFGAPGTFGTCQESDNRYNGQAAPNGFMGPSLWPSDLDVYGRSNPAAVRGLGFDLGSHLDMLHESPFCMGIEWSEGNAYWIFEGATSSLMLADFKQDHGVGWDDHSDGVMMRYAIGQVSRVPDVPSHLTLDHESGLLYVADTGNSRVGVFNTNGFGQVRRVRGVEPGTQVGEVSNGPEVITLIEDLERPSGIELHDGLLFVTDNATGEVSAWTLDGELVDRLPLDVAPGGLMGLTFDDEGRLYVVDALANQLLRISPR